MKITMKNKKEMEIREVKEEKVVYLSHYDLKTLAGDDEIMFDFPHMNTVNTGTFASVMCVVSSMDGKRSYGTGQAQTLKWATDMAFDNAMIDLYRLNGKSSVELEILKKLKADQDRKPADEKAAKAAEEKAAKEAASRKAAEEKAVKEAAAKKAAEEKAAKEAAEKKAAEEAAAKKAAEEAAAKKAAEEKAAKEAAEKKAAEEAAAKKAAEEAAKKAAEERAAARKAAEEDAARKAAQEAASKGSAPAAGGTGYWYANEPDWVGCHSLTLEDPDDVLINYGPFKQTAQPSELKPGPKYLSQVLKYRSDFVEKLVGIQPSNFIDRIPQILTYCSRQGIGLHATSGKARDVMQKYGVKELA